MEKQYIETKNINSYDKDLDLDCMPDNLLLRSTVKVERSPFTLVKTLKHEDQSQRHYRQRLIGKFDTFKQGNKPQMKIQWLSIFQKNPKKLKYKSLLSLFNQNNGLKIYKGLERPISFILKQNTKYIFQLSFTVKDEIVYGLTLTNNIYKFGFKIDKNQHAVGSYGPGSHDIDFAIKTPSGFLGRGDYLCKIVVVDKQGQVYGKIQYEVTIK